MPLPTRHVKLQVSDAVYGSGSWGSRAVHATLQVVVIVMGVPYHTDSPAVKGFVQGC